MLALDYLIPTVLTPANINANIAALNTQYAPLTGYTAVPTLDANLGVVNLWARAWQDLAPPVVAYEVAFLREGTTEIVLQGKNRDEFPVWITCVAKAPDEKTARYQIAVYWEALRMTLDVPTAAGLEGQQLSGVNPIRQITKIGPTIMTELVDVAVTGAGKRLGLRTRWLMTLDTVRS